VTAIGGWFAGDRPQRGRIGMDKTWRNEPSRFVLTVQSVRSANALSIPIAVIRQTHIDEICDSGPLAEAD
jgi:hypothetical protein